MKLRVALLVAALVGGAACRNSPDPKPQAPAAADPWQGSATAKQPMRQPLFWAAERGGKTTYLLGTMHVGVDPEARLPQLVWDKLDAAAAFAVETDISDPALARIGERSGGGTLRDELGPAYWKKLEDALGASIAQAFERKSAMIPATILALRGLPQTPPMDAVLLGRARGQQKRIAFLEPAAHQVAILEKHMNAKALKTMLDDLGKVEQQTKAMLEAYLSGEEAAILALTAEQRRDALAHGYTAAEYDESMEDLLYRRNASWIAPIEALHESGPAFIAVGAAHLVGPRSVIEELQRKGFKISRVAP